MSYDQVMAAILRARHALLLRLPHEEVTKQLADTSAPENVAEALAEAIRRGFLSERQAGRDEMTAELVCEHPRAVLWKGRGEPKRDCPWCVEVRGLRSVLRATTRELCSGQDSARRPSEWVR